ncbi:ribonucleoside hydrolase RihC [Apilactobacillus sp. M161]|uniref:Ribonucleoside hydrolase RihC n=1 Tax=Apilactobacillus xinyiensis TaxID=2841032 RepID=A0ABT0I2B0_9LACO|nr:ribonucleoside hydrolase RihC [Apilactobacillus xinyiensis]MCK8624856.1 ribonucleoside hydrolase RihC [Apilactobacillus xinyiensis]
MTDIIMDCDPGIDDAVALSIALNNSHLNVKLVTTVAGNVSVDKTTKNALNIINFFGKAKTVRVAAGAKQPLIKAFEDAARIHGSSGIGGYQFTHPSLVPPLKVNAVQALYNEIMQSSNPITLVATGSYTNVALLLSEYPEVAKRLTRIIAMGGSLSSGNMTSVAEFNCFTDPHAAEIMYQSGVPIVMVRLDITNKALLTHATLQTIAHLNSTGKMLYDIISADGDQNNQGVAMHDVNTIFYLLHPEFIHTQAFWIDVQTTGPANGATVGDIRGAYHNGKTNAEVCTDIDVQAFNNWFINEVKQMPF